MTAGLVDVGILVPAVVARGDMDRIDAVRAEEGFAETGAIERAIVGVGLESDNAAGAGVPSQVLYQLLKISEKEGGGTDGSDNDAGARWMEVGSATP